MNFLSKAIDSPRHQLVVARHHPDRLRRPEPRIGAVECDRFVHALTWNVFRTLELLPPAFWLRRLHARLARQVPVRAAQVVRVTLWPLLEASPAHALAGGTAHVVPDVLIETEYDVWALLTGPVLQQPDAGVLRKAVTDLHEAARWRAGARDCHLGAITLSVDDTMLATFQTSPTTASSRVRPFPRMSTGPTAPYSALGAVPLDVIHWAELADVLRDCAGAAVLPPIERVIASNAVSWMQDVGVGTR